MDTTATATLTATDATWLQRVQAATLADANARGEVWGSDELIFLRDEHARGETLESIAYALDRTYYAVQTMVKRVRVRLLADVTPRASATATATATATVARFAPCPTCHVARNASGECWTCDA